MGAAPTRTILSPRRTGPLSQPHSMRAWVRSKDFIPAPFALRMEGTLALEEAGIALARWPAPAPLASAATLPTLLTSRRTQAAADVVSKSGGQATSGEETGDLEEQLA